MNEYINDNSYQINITYDKATTDLFCEGVDCDQLSSPISDWGVSVTVSHYNPYRNSNVTITYDNNREKRIEVNPLGTKDLKQL